jgi:hypothetical protein
MVINKKYFYEKCGKIKNRILLKETKAFYIFDNGDYIERYKTLFETEAEAETITETANKIVKAWFVNTYVPEVVHIPNKFTK